MQIRKLIIIIFLIIGVTGCGRSTHDMTNVETQSMGSTESMVTETQEVVGNEENIPNSQQDSQTTSEESIHFSPQGEMSVSWVGETDIGGIQEVALDSTAYQTRLILKACQDLNAFQLLAFSVENVDENGNVTYQEQTLFGMDSMNKGTSLVLGMSFLGEVPFYGVSYLDENGVEKKYCFQIDAVGEPVLMEWDEVK